MHTLEKFTAVHFRRYLRLHFPFSRTARGDCPKCEETPGDHPGKWLFPRPHYYGCRDPLSRIDEKIGKWP